jgi:hypothetical protein
MLSLLVELSFHPTANVTVVVGVGICQQAKLVSRKETFQATPL